MMTNWIKTYDSQYVNADEIARTGVTMMYASETTFRWVLVLHLKNDAEVAYSRSELLKDEVFNEDYTDADGVRSDECRQALLDELDRLTENELA
jgi:hypothetical protein